MSDLDLSNLAPGDAATALRSLPRRFRAAMGPVAGDDATADELAHRMGPDGHAAADELLAVVRGLPLLQEAAVQVLTTDDPVLHPGLGDIGPGTWDVPAHLEVRPTLDQLADVSEAFASRIEHVAAEDWTRTGRVADGRDTVAALDLVRAAVRLGVGSLRAAERTITAVKGRPG